MNNSGVMQTLLKTIIVLLLLIRMNKNMMMMIMPWKQNSNFTVTIININKISLIKMEKLSNNLLKANAYNSNKKRNYLIINNKAKSSKKTKNRKIAKKTWIEFRCSLLMLILALKWRIGLLFMKAIQPNN